MQTSRANPSIILSVEDDPGDQRLIKEFLGETGAHFVLHFVSDGLQALQFLKRQGKFIDAPVPDLILLDLNLPVLNGREVLDQLKTDPELLHIPTVIFSTSTLEDDIFSSYQRHANSYFFKPADIDEFALVMRRIAEHWLWSASLPQSRFVRSA